MTEEKEPYITKNLKETTDLKGLPKSELSEEYVKNLIGLPVYEEKKVIGKIVEITKVDGTLGVVVEFKNPSINKELNTQKKLE